MRNEMLREMISYQVTRLAVALKDFDADAPRLQAWGCSAARTLTAGGRLLACADGAGSRELAHHLVAELRSSLGDDRPALTSAVVVPADEKDLAHGPHMPGRSLAEQVLSRGRPGDILFCLSAARPSDALLDAARAGTACGLTTRALTAPASALLAAECSDAVVVRAEDARVVEEIHLVAIHVFCTAVDSCVRDRVRAHESLSVGKFA
jgi:D-sedoheptulose 7-phosphate isomerase